MHPRLIVLYLAILSALSIRADILHEQLAPAAADNSLFIGAQKTSAQVAAIVAPYKGGEPAILVAVTSGGNYLKLYRYYEEDRSLVLLEDISVGSGIPHHVAFLQFPIGPDGELHWCLTIPRWDRNFAKIDIYDLESCTLYTDCWSDDAQSQAYHVADLGNGTYGINVENSINICTFDPGSVQFSTIHRTTPEEFYYGASSYYAPARTCETQLFQYTNESGNSVACLTTMHNGGIRIWDPESPFRILSRIGVVQHGDSGLYYYDEDDHRVVNSELGDVHRAVILNGIDPNSNRGIEPRLLFFSNNTMGYLIYDISVPEEPQFIWQWDNDTRLGADSDFNWHGAGCDNEPISNQQASPATFPGCSFGIGLRAEQSNSSIHLFLADGRSGLLCFDLSYFLSPFGYDPERNFRSISIDPPFKYSIGDDSLHAYDLCTLDLGEDGSLVFTTWKTTNDTEAPESYIGLSVHLDGPGGNAGSSSDTGESNGLIRFMQELIR